VVDYLRPLQERYAELARDPSEVGRVLELGAEKAEASAEPIMARIRTAVGLLPRG
jgi:tryptophanyl-tRNA synthetase